VDPAEYDYMFQLEDSLWWYVGMRRIVDGMLSRNLGNGGSPARVLDAGCGTGGSLAQLGRFGEVTAFDFEPRAAAMSATREHGRIMVASTDAIPFADEIFDLVTSFDVICQLESPADEQALTEMARVLKPGGSLVVRVPAIQALYGPHDVTLHTKHRYSSSELAKKVEKAGLRLRESTYANTILFPVAMARRLLAKVLRSNAEGSDVRPVAAPINTALTAVLAVEAAILRRTRRLPFGLSVIVMATKA
jgi:SAM-dependent methyltransferase